MSKSVWKIWKLLVAEEMQTIKESPHRFHPSHSCAFEMCLWETGVRYLPPFFLSAWMKHSGQCTERAYLQQHTSKSLNSLLQGVVGMKSVNDLRKICVTLCVLYPQLPICKSIWRQLSSPGDHWLTGQAPPCTKLLFSHPAHKTSDLTNYGAWNLPVVTFIWILQLLVVFKNIGCKMLEEIL